jgi:alkanesulfonate monooxygenase SsuD/methylene tetrahydromethanopterin reductase-like flavin-dependent oxidoreductase (luciferase family)
MSPPLIELLWWNGCPSWTQTLADLQVAAAAAGLDPDRIVVREIDDDAHAEAERFVGSPTIRVDGTDILPPGEGETPSLTCRIYHLRDGRVSPTPDPEDLRDALTRVAARA